MENNKINNENIINKSENKFEIEYFGQNMENNESFLEWQKEMKKKYVNKCIKDKIYFYSKVDDNQVGILYQEECPICIFYICYHCSKLLKKYGYFLSGKCCLYRRIYNLFFIDGKLNSDCHFDVCINFCSILKSFFIPIYSLIYLFFEFSESFFYVLYTNKFNSDNNEYESYNSYIKKKDLIT